MSLNPNIINQAQWENVNVILELPLKPFIIEVLKWTLPFLNLDLSTAVNRGNSVKSKKWQTVKILMRWLVTFLS